MRERNHLSQELKKYGYIFSVKNTFILLAAAIAGSYLLAVFFQLKPLYLMFFMLYVVCYLPFFIRNAYKNKYEQQRFSDANTYIEQFLYSFQKSGKILTTLKEVGTLFGDGEMLKTIKEAIDYSEHAYEDVDLEKNGLAIIERNYPADQIRTMHHFATMVERDGGSFDTSLLVLLESRRMWAARVYELLNEKKRQRMNVIISVIISLLLCSMIYLITMKMDFSLASFEVTQIATLCVMMVDFFIFYLADKKLCVDVLSEKKESDSEILKTYNRIQKYDDRKFFDRIGKKTAKKAMTYRIEREYPKWLLEIGLLLQSENVSVAIFKSYDNAPMVLRPYLQEFIQELKMHPDSMKPFNDFLKDYQLPEIHSAMKMLYAISEGTGSNTSAQITEMLKQNEKMMDRAQKMKNEDMLAGMYALFLAPQVTAGAKLLVDMMVLLVIYLGKMGGQVVLQGSTMLC